MTNDAPPAADDPVNEAEHGGSEATAEDKVDPGLALQLGLHPTSEHAVVVEFATVPSAEALAGLDLRSGSESSATGVLTAEQVWALARRDDVVHIDPRPQARLH